MTDSMAAVNDLLRNHLDGVLGFEHLEVTPEFARARFAVEDRVKQPLGVVHGGAYSALAESLASGATLLAVMPEGSTAIGLSTNTSFVRPATAGYVHAEARRIHRGRTSWVWVVDMTDDAGNLVATSRVTLAVKPFAEAEA